MEDYIRRIINLFQERIGMNPDSLSHDHLVKSILERMKALDTDDISFYYKVLTSSQTEFQALVEFVVNPETWFFRDRIVFDFLSSTFKREWRERFKDSRKLRILSLACSSGEEPYSIAIALFLSGFEAASFEIDAVDISEEALKKAQSGIYSKNSFRKIDPILQHRFFIQKGNSWEIAEQLRNQVKFIHFNPFDFQSYKKKGFYDVIFCRNLLIYLNSSAQFKLLKFLDRLLLPEKGVLIVGSVEGELVRKFGYIHHLHTHAPVFLKRGAFKTVLPDLQSKADPIQLVDIKTQPLDLAAARAMAERGDFEQALSICQTLLKGAREDPSIYYLMGLVDLAKKDFKEAESNFKKAIYLQPDHYLALTQLEFLEKKRGNTVRAQLFQQRRKKIEDFLKREDKELKGYGQ